jgi:hypothetical protein
MLGEYAIVIEFDLQEQGSNRSMAGLRQKIRAAEAALFVF